MVDLETNAIPHESDAATLPDEPRCRLCHGSAADCGRNIFETNVPATSEPLEGTAAQTETAACTGARYAELLYDLFKIKYESHELLSSIICKYCQEMVEAFDSFRSCLQRSEEELQKRLAEIKTTVAKYRPGLNGNPGEFEPEEGCEIIEVDPEMEYLSSDDEFSMESNSAEEEDDAADMAPSENPLPIDSVQQLKAAQFLNPATTNFTAMEANGLVPTSLVTPNQRIMSSSTTIVQDGYLGSGVMPTGGIGDVYPKNTFLCQFCDLAFTTQSDCHDHELHQHDPMQPYSCNFCQIRLSTRPSLINHIKEQHDADRPYVCAHCNKGFCRRSDLKKHTIVHTGVRPFTCSVCTKSFSRNTNLTKHMRIHNGIKPFVCQLCPRSFHTEVELMRHTRSHTEVKPFHCSRCPSSFTRKDKLNIHEQVHVRRDAEQLQQNIALANNMSNITADGGAAMLAPPPLPQFSDPAEQTIYQSNLLAAQLQQQQQLLAKVAGAQTQSKPFGNSRTHICDICDRTFQRERDLQRHQALHLDTLFTCKLCGLGFSRREKLARHELEQHAPHYPCDICRITFTRQDELEHHLKMHELQQNVALTTQAALNAVQQQQKTSLMPDKTSLSATQLLELPHQQRPTAADMSFYSNLVPTMNLGFYSETHPEERNGV